MRALTIAAGLCLAATAASATVTYETVSRTDTNITLTNGCVYAPAQFRSDNTWTFVHANAGTAKTCPLMVRPIERDIAFKVDYLVGVYR